MKAKSLIKFWFSTEDDLSTKQEALLDAFEAVVDSAEPGWRTGTVTIEYTWSAEEPLKRETVDIGFIQLPKAPSVIFTEMEIHSVVFGENAGITNVFKIQEGLTDEQIITELARDQIQTIMENYPEDEPEFVLRLVESPIAELAKKIRG